MRLLRILPIVIAMGSLASGCGIDDDEIDPTRYPVIPAPADIEPKTGEFVLGEGTGIVFFPSEDPELEAVVSRWAADVRRRSGLPLPVYGPGEDGGRGLIRIEVTGIPEHAGPRVPAGEGLPGVEAERYELEVTSRGIEVEAPGNPGVFYALQTLDQLFSGPGSPTPWSVPAGEIDDVPRFPYRGMHLDVGRHFFPASFIKRYIDLLAAYKMNVFHWHLTEDQGWRLEIRGRPLLTEVGSCRAETILEKNFEPYQGDGVEYCGFYTQEEAREIVAYARERFVTVMPEIEMPGHSVAALAAYPELGCTSGPFQVSTRWGVERNIYCPKEETFDFLEEVLTEVMDIFPSRFIHIGGDEAPKAAWQESALAQEVMERESLGDEEELQSWFIRRIEEYLNQNGRRLVGWDEILEGGLAPDATVMSWRGMAGGIEAAREGHEVVMTPTGYAYFDYYQGDTLQEPLAIGGFTPLERVYSFDPVPPELSPREAGYVLGAQGNVWTEYIRTTEYVEYMVFPRMLALSEVAWSPRSRRDWAGFSARLPSHLTRLDHQVVNYRVPDVQGLEEDRLFLEGSALVELEAPVEAGAIRYTLDGRDPSPESPVYDGPFVIPVSQEGTQVAARVYLGDGREGAIRRARFTRTQLMAPTHPPRRTRDRGLAVRAFVGRFRSVDALEAEPEVASIDRSADRLSSAPRVIIPEGVPASPFGLILTGFIRVPRKGIYTFHLSSDDGSRLTIGNRVVVNHDGPHSMAERAGQVALHRGWHPLEIRYFQSGGGSGLRLELEGPGVSRREVPAHWFAHSRE